MMFRLRNTLFVVLASALAGSAVSAQCSPRWDSSISPSLAGFDGSVYCIQAWDPDGSGPAPELIVVGGGFSVIGQGIPMHRIAAWDGTSWTSLGDALNSGAVYALSVYGGELVAAGDFTLPGGLPFNGVASFDGTTWHPRGSFGVASPWVTSMAVYNGDLYVGGELQSIDGVTVHRIGRWDGSAWHDAGGGMNGVVFALLTFAGSLFAGGSFTSAGGVAAMNVARWDGASWHPVGTGLGSTSHAVKAMTIHAGALVAGGEFWVPDGTNAQGVAYWNGAAWQSFAGTELLGVAAVASYGGELIAGGNIMFQDLARGYIARWNGSAWLALGAGASARVSALAVLQGQLIAGGIFTSVDGVSARGLARHDAVGWHGFASGMDSIVTDIHDLGHQLVIGGEFSTLPDGTAAKSIAAWDGSWHAFGAGLEHVNAVGSFQGEVVAASRTQFNAGGSPGTYSGPTRISRWHGQSWQSLGLTNGNVNAFMEFQNELYAAGRFSTLDGLTANRIARWDGIAWHPVGTGLGTATQFAEVENLCTYAGELIAVGWIPTAGSIAINHAAAWDGGAWHSVGGGVAGSSSISSYLNCATEHAGELVIGGRFLTAGGVPANHIAAWNGSAWQALTAGGPQEWNTVEAVVSADGELAAEGLYQDGSGYVRHVAGWGPTGWTPFGGPISNIVYSLVARPGEIFAGGRFVAIGSQTAAFLSAWRRPGPRLYLSQPGGMGMPVLVRNEGLITGNEYYNIFSVEPCATPGSGPYLGLCASDPSFLVTQFLLPAGAVPFHMVATAPTASYGPFPLPSGLVLDGVSFDFTGGALGCVGPVVRYLVP